jgi:hypothetical protein
VKRINLSCVKERLLELDPGLKGHEGNEPYKTALVLLSALACGPDTARLAAFTALPPEFVAMIRQRMIRAQLWTEIDTCCDHWFVADGVFSTSLFWADALVAQGLVVRQWDEAAGQYRYWEEAFAPQIEPGPRKQ